MDGDKYADAERFNENSTKKTGRKEWYTAFFITFNLLTKLAPHISPVVNNISFILPFDKSNHLRNFHPYLTFSSRSYELT